MHENEQLCIICAHTKLICYTVMTMNTRRAKQLQTISAQCYYKKALLNCTKMQ